MTVKLQQSPLSSAEMRRSPEMPAIKVLFSVFLKKLITNDPGGMLGRIRVKLKIDRKDPKKTIKPNMFNRFFY